MSKVHAVLLVPEPGDPHGLLAEGPCGARPPIACWDGERWKSWTDNGWWWPVIPGRRALVLAWGGKPVPEGLDRLGRAPAVTREWVSHVVGVALGWWPGDVEALTDHQLPGTLVLLDAEGQEVNDEQSNTIF